MLPESYVNTMKELLGEEEAAKYFESFDKTPFAGMRINTLKTDVDEFLKMSPYELRPVPWTRKGFYYNNSDKPAKHPFYYAGLYYLQEPSAMVPASILPVNPSDKVLDLCAAPGGKTTELGAKLNRSGLLVSNDISPSRAKALLKNVEICGIPNAIVTNEAPYSLAKHFSCFFDKILVDAPCSGEGMFRKDNSIIKNYEQYGTAYYNNIQKEIILYAADMLRPGGDMVYSTCTFSPLEDEQLITYLINERPCMSISHIVLDNGIDANDDDYPLDFGRPQWSDGDETLKECARLWPHKLEGEGHFAVLLHKGEDAPYTAPAIGQTKTRPDKLDETFLEFIKKINIDFDMDRFLAQGTKIYYLPEGKPDMKGIRIMRNGLFMGEVKTKRFEPSQALASSLRADEFDNVLSLGADDDRVIRYLKGETIEADDEKLANGYVLVCVEGKSLGFAKNNNGSLKNKYLPGWRWM